MKFPSLLALSLLFAVSGCVNTSTPIGTKESKWLGTMLSVKIIEQSGDVTVYQKIGDTEYYYFKKGVLVYRSETRVPIVLASNPVPAPAAEAPPITLIAEAATASPVSTSAPALGQENITRPTLGENEVKRVKVKKPDQMPAAFAAAFNSGSLEQLLSLFEAEAVLTPATGQRKSGNLRASLSELLARRGSMKAKIVFATKTDSIALVQAEFQLSTVDFNGSPVQQTLKTHYVLRQQADGSWRCAIAQPLLPE